MYKLAMKYIKKKSHKYFLLKSFHIKIFQQQIKKSLKFYKNISKIGDLQKNGDLQLYLQFSGDSPSFERFL